MMPKDRFENLIHLLALLAILLLAAGAAEGRGARLKPVAGDPYPVYKRVFEKKIDQGKIAVEILRDSGAVDLTDCIHGSTYLESDPGPELSGEARRLADLAYEVVRLGRLLRKIGYPEAVWRPLLADLERKGRKGFTPARGGYLEKLSETLNAYRRRSARSLPTTVVEGCGEGA
jgi:hypothetical protein